MLLLLLLVVVSCDLICFDATLLRVDSHSSRFNALRVRFVQIVYTLYIRELLKTEEKHYCSCRSLLNARARCCCCCCCSILCRFFVFFVFLDFLLQKVGQRTRILFYSKYYLYEASHARFMKRLRRRRRRSSSSSNKRRRRGRERNDC